MGATMRVLVLEDDPLVLSAFRRAFPLFGLELLAATTRSEALEIAVRGIDAGILDLQLPNEPYGGLDAAADVRELRSDVPLVLYSGHDEQRVRDHCRNLNVFYVIKPAPVQLLVEYLRLNEAARKHSGTRQIVDVAAACERCRQECNLSAMETAILKEGAQGGTRATIAAKMNISPETVKTHVRNLLAKTGDESLASAGARLVREIVEQVSSTKRRGG